MKGFMITYGQPHKPTPSDTILRWIKDKLGITGINEDVYKAHSSLSASTIEAREIVLALPTF